MNELTEKIWSGIEARLVDIKHALAVQKSTGKKGRDIEACAHRMG